MKQEEGNTEGEEEQERVRYKLDSSKRNVRVTPVGRAKLRSTRHICSVTSRGVGCRGVSCRGVTVGCFGAAR